MSKSHFNSQSIVMSLNWQEFTSLSATNSQSPHTFLPVLQEICIIIQVKNITRITIIFSYQPFNPCFQKNMLKIHSNSVIAIDFQSTLD